MTAHQRGSTWASVIAEGIEEHARQLYKRVAQFPNNPGNLRGARGLTRLARYVESLPDSDPRIEQLVRSTHDFRTFNPGPILSRELLRFRSVDPKQDLDSFLSLLVARAVEDAEQRGESAPATGTGVSRIVVDTYAADGKLVQQAFTGRWLIEDFEWVDEEMVEWRCGIAETRGGRYALYRYKGSARRDATEARLTVYGSLDDLEAEERPPEDIIAAIKRDPMLLELDI